MGALATPPPRPPPSQICFLSSKTRQRLCAPIGFTGLLEGRDACREEACFDKGVLISERKGDSECKAGFQLLPLLGSPLRTRGCRQDTGLTRILHKPPKHHVSPVPVTRSHLAPSQTAAVATFPLPAVRCASGHPRLTSLLPILREPPPGLPPKAKQSCLPWPETLPFSYSLLLYTQLPHQMGHATGVSVQVRGWRKLKTLAVTDPCLCASRCPRQSLTLWDDMRRWCLWEGIIS